MRENTIYVNIPDSRLNLLKQFIRGSLLGDGSIPKIGRNSKNNSLSFGHGPKQEGYLKWKNEFLRSYSLCSGKINKCISISDRYKSGQCVSYHFRSFAHPLFTEYRNMYYLDGRKILCKEDIQEIDEFGLAIWFMDDGNVWSRKKRTSCLVMNTTGFYGEEVKYLMNLLYSKWKINCSYLISDNCIRISVDSSPHFLDIVRPYIISGLEYKWVLLKPDEFGEQPEVVNPEPSQI